MSGTNGSEEIRRMEGHRPVPTGFLVFFFALLAWGAWYTYTYTPEISGWSAYRELEGQAGKGAGAPAPSVAPAAAAKGNPFAGDASAVEEGEEIFGRECSGCHGRDMRNPSGGPDLRAALSYGDDEASLFASVSGGRPGGMPPFAASLGTDRTWKVVAYVLHERSER